MKKVNKRFARIEFVYNSLSEEDKLKITGLKLTCY